MPNCACSNIVNMPKQHVYIVLFKGDDSDFAWNQNIEVTLDTEMDLTGFKAKFSFMDFSQTFNDITSKKLVLVFPATATAEFPLGAADASIVLYDTEGKVRTIANRIHIIVTKCVDEAYANEDPQAITVSISSSMEREQSDWTETDTQSPSYIRNKPEIPSIDTTLTHSGEAADAKVVGDALRSGFTEWEFNGVPSGYSCRVVGFTSNGWEAQLWEDGSPGLTENAYDIQHDGDALSLTFEFTIDGTPVGVTASRNLITPTKTSQLTNDGAPNGGGTPYATTEQIPTVPSAYTSTPEMDGVGSAGSSTSWAKGDHVHPSDTSKLDGASSYPSWERGTVNPPVVFHNGRIWIRPEDAISGSVNEPVDDSAVWEKKTLDELKQDTLTTAQMNAVNSGVTAAKVATWDGYAAQISQKANASDVNAALAQKANTTDLPYALVTLGEWVTSDAAYVVVEADGAEAGAWWSLVSASDPSSAFGMPTGNKDSTSLTFVFGSDDTTVTATRSFNLLDRAGNRVEVTGATTLTLPAAITGYLRDFLVRLEISGSTVPTITFAAPTGETLTYETDGDDFPVPDEAGTWSYSFTENCVAHKFAVSLKKVNTVAQGGV